MRPAGVYWPRRRLQVCLLACGGPLFWTFALEGLETACQRSLKGLLDLHSHLRLRCLGARVPKGRVTLQLLSPGYIQKLYADMRERGLSAQTVLHTHRLLFEAMRHAVKWGIQDNIKNLHLNV